ncbi:MAG: CU044_2847 family protein [Synechococcales bacterium]|nr:CU044_2847 family protein [Synechococcales bacterium]
MGKLKPVELEDGSIVYLEASGDLDVSEVETDLGFPDEDEEEITRTAKSPSVAAARMAARLKGRGQSMDALIRTYTLNTLRAFQNVAFAEIEKVSLEFGVTVDVATGIPYIASGTAACNIKVQVECKFPSQSSSEAEDGEEAK